jgi:N-hydroxyarylamine O-acetyltransferase
MCLYHQTSPDSHFTKQRLCSIATATGRISLTDDRLIVTENGIRTVHVISHEQEFERTLARHFGIIP